MVIPHIRHKITRMRSCRHASFDWTNRLKLTEAILNEFAKSSSQNTKRKRGGGVGGGELSRTGRAGIGKVQWRNSLPAKFEDQRPALPKSGRYRRSYYLVTQRALSTLPEESTDRLLLHKMGINESIAHSSINLFRE